MLYAQVFVGTNQIDMKDMESPIHTSWKSHAIGTALGDLKTSSTLELSPRAFEDRDDIVGLLESDPEPFEFLEEEGLTKETLPGTGYKTIDFAMQVGRKQTKIERQVYSIFALIGDAGGFNSAIIFFPYYFMSFYSSRMYQRAIASEVPVSRAKNRKNRRQGSQELQSLAQKLNPDAPASVLT